MGIAYNTSIARNGLVLHYDPANIKSYSPNLVDWSQTFTASAGWTPQAGLTIVSTTEVAPDGTNTATTLEDTLDTQYSFIFKNITVPNDSQTYMVSLYIKKGDATSPGFAVNSGINGGTTVATNQRLETDTGAVQSASVIDEGDYWRMYWTLTNNSSGNTNIYLNIYPAARLATGGGDTVTAVGQNTIWGVMVTRGSTLVDYKPSFGSSADQILDLSGNGNSGTLFNSAGYSSSGGGSIQLDGVDQYIRTLNSPSIEMVADSPVSISYWMYLDTAVSVSATSFYAPIQKHTFSSSYGHLIGPNDRLILYADNDSSVEYTSSTSILAGQWINITSVYTTTSISLYINGQLERTDTGTFSLTTNQQPIYIGANNGTAYFFEGKISTMMIYNVALTSDQVKQNFEALRGRYSV